MDLITRDDTRILKGIAIIMVVVQHLGQAVDIGIVNPLGPIGVFLFLFLSGYGLTCSYLVNGRREYLKKKIMKVYAPYAFAIVLFLLWSFVIRDFPESGTIIKYFFFRSLPQGSYWYMLLLFYWYIMFYFLSFVIDRDVPLILGLILFAALILMVQKFSPIYVWQFASFPIGVITARYPTQTDSVAEQLKKRGGGGIF